MTCPLLEPPPNCDIEYTNEVVFESTALYACDPGFVIGSGDPERICRAIGTWSGIAASCVGEDIINIGTFKYNIIELLAVAPSLPPSLPPCLLLSLSFRY